VTHPDVSNAIPIERGASTFRDVVSDEDFSVVARDLLGHEPMSLHELGERFRRAGHDIDADELLARLRSDVGIVEVAAGFASTGHIVDDVCFVVKVSPVEASAGHLFVEDRLDPIVWWLIGNGETPLEDSTGEYIGTLTVETVLRDRNETDALVGPPGWLNALGGTRVALTLRHGRVHIGPVLGPTEPSRTQTAAVMASFERGCEREVIPGSGSDADEIEVVRMPTDQLLLDAIAGARGIFEGAQVELALLLASAGLVARQSEAIGAEITEEALAEADRLRQLRARYALVDPLTARFRALVDALAQRTSLEEAVPHLHLLDDGAVAEAVFVECFMSGALPPKTLASCDRLLRDVIHGSAPIGLRWLRARCLIEVDRVAEAAAELDGLAAEGGDHAGVLWDRAIVAAARSDMRRAYDLATRVAAEHEGRRAVFGAHAIRRQALELLEDVEPFVLERPAPTARRNDPCPCGSGRKYKACHLGHELHPIEDRAGFVHSKAVRYAHRQSGEPSELAWAFADAMYEEADHDLQDHPVVIELALCQLGVMRRFLDAYAGVLPTDGGDAGRTVGAGRPGCLRGPGGGRRLGRAPQCGQRRPHHGRQPRPGSRLGSRRSLVR